MYPPPVMRTGSGMVRLALAVVGVGALTAPARAQQMVCPPNVAPQFCKAYDDGVTEYNRARATRDFSKAKAQFQKALDFEKKLPGPYRYLAEIAREEGKFADCLKLAVTAIKLNPESEVAPEVRKTHAACRQGLEYPEFREQFAGGGAISVQTPGIDGAKVKLNGLTMGATPFPPRPLAVGPVEVEVNKPGYISAKTEVEIYAGLVTDVIFDMKEDPNAPKDGGGPDRPGDEVPYGWIKLDLKTAGSTATFDGKPPELDDQGRIRADAGLHDVRVDAAGHDPWIRRVRVARGQSRTIDVSLRDSGERRGQRTKGWLALGAAIVLAGAGSGFALLEADAFEEANDIWFNETRRAPGDADGQQIPLRTREDLADARSRGKRYQLMSLASYGLAAAALGVSAWFFVKERPAERKGYPPPVAFTPIFAPGDSGVGVQATYTKEIDW